jgi:hypothetical protein
MEHLPPKTLKFCDIAETYIEIAKTKKEKFPGMHI